MSISYWRNLYSQVAEKVLDTKNIRHKMPSLIFSQERFNANDFLINMALNSTKIAWDNMIIVPNENLTDAIFYNIFPGEHYRILNAVVKILNPSLVVEVGTFTGMGSIALKQELASGKLYTFDIVPWHSFESHLSINDFDKNNIRQILSDLSIEEEFNKYSGILSEAEIIFMDAPKDGLFEYKFLSMLSKLKSKNNKLLIIDDIRFVNMIDLWISIEAPKIDISSFGHWSGTGFVDISQGFGIKNLS